MVAQRLANLQAIQKSLHGKTNSLKLIEQLKILESSRVYKENLVQQLLHRQFLSDRQQLR